MCAVIPLLTATLFLLAVRAADTCYYPDGSVADKDIPCSSSSSGAACCPQGWQCLDDGICHFEKEDWITRYTCTDRSWDSAACPQYCLGGTPNGTDVGNVALLECSDNQYCCNGDRSGNCCKDKAVSLFAISPGADPTGMGSVTATSAAPATSSASETSPAPAATSTSKPVSTRADPSTSSSTKETSQSSAALATTVITSVVGNPTNGAASTVYLTRTAAAPAETSSSEGASSSSSSNNSVIVGCAVGIPLSAALLAIVTLLLFRRRRRRKREYSNNSLLPRLSTIPEENEKGPRISELDGYPRATGGGIAPHRMSGVSEYYPAKGHTRTTSEADGTPREKPPAELESPRNSRLPPVELDAADTRSIGGYFRISPAVGGTAGSSPDPSRGYAVGGVAPPGGLRIVNAVEGELDSEAEGEGEGRTGSAGHARSSEVRIESPPPVYQSPRTWRQARGSLPGESSGGAADGSPESLGSPVSPIQGHGWRR